MNIKSKLRRGFEQAAPDVWGQVQGKLPQQKKTAAQAVPVNTQKKSPLWETLSTAAALAMAVVLVGGSLWMYLTYGPLRPSNPDPNLSTIPTDSTPPSTEPTEPPTVPPTEPSTEPTLPNTEPTVPPTEPPAPPTEPTVPPTEPPVPPTEPPTEPPAEPPTEPTEPQGELAEIAVLFQYYKENWYNMSLTSFYTKPQEVNLAKFFYNGFQDIPAKGPTAEEAELLKDMPGFDVAYDLIRLPRERMEAVLQEFWGLQLSDFDLNGLYYVASTDTYYLSHTDAAGLIDIQFENLVKAEDGTITVDYTDGIRKGTVTLAPNGDSYRVVANKER